MCCVLLLCSVNVDCWLGFLFRVCAGVIGGMKESVVRVRNV